jgi:hypothetical protein
VSLVADLDKLEQLALGLGAKTQWK